MNLFDSLLNLVAPDACAGCDLPLESDERGFCGGCRPLIETVETARRPPAPTASLYLYRGPMADALRRFKYEGRSELAPVLGGLCADVAHAYAGHVDCVIPLPLHPARRKSRGYNQSALLALPVARKLSVPMRTGILSRMRYTRPQVGLSAKERIANVELAFCASHTLSGQRVLLIDDVTTTGATLASARRALRAAGVEDVFALTLAYADLDAAENSEDVRLAS